MSDDDRIGPCVACGDYHPSYLCPPKPEVDRVTPGGRIIYNAKSVLAMALKRKPIDGAALIAAERNRQRTKEGYTLKHDDEHVDASLAVIAAALLVDGTRARVTDGLLRVDSDGDDKWGLLVKHRDDRLRVLVIAGALVSAEIERVIRMRRQPTRKR